MGWDKYRNREELLNHIYRAQKEFRRVLKDNGVLFFKWGEQKIKVASILPLFRGWTLLMRIPVNWGGRMGKSNVFWLALYKRDSNIKQLELDKLLC